MFCCALLFNYNPAIWGYFAVCPYRAAVVDEDGGIMIIDTLKRGPDCILKGKLKLVVKFSASFVISSHGELILLLLYSTYMQNGRVIATQFLMWIGLRKMLTI